MKPNYDFLDDGRFDPTRVGQSVLATLGGWVVGALASGFGIYAPFALYYMAPFVLPAWIFFVLPHALLLPRHHFLTRPAIAWFYGALWGLAILWLYQVLRIHTTLGASELFSSYHAPVGATVTGAVTGLIASRFERRYT